MKIVEVEIRAMHSSRRGYMEDNFEVEITGWEWASAEDHAKLATEVRMWVLTRWDLDRYRGDRVDIEWRRGALPWEKMTIVIEPDHAAMQRSARGDPTCKHVWIGYGRSEPDQYECLGIYSLGASKMKYTDRCRHCGLEREIIRERGDADRVSYATP